MTITINDHILRELLTLPLKVNTTVIGHYSMIIDFYFYFH